jgi:hypothetical protein
MAGLIKLFCRHSGTSRNPFGVKKTAIGIKMDPGLTSPSAVVKRLAGTTT